MIEINLEELKIVKVFPGLIMGKGKAEDYKNNLDSLVKEYENEMWPSIFINVDEMKWTWLHDNVGTYGHFCVAKLTINDIPDNYDRYSFNLFFHYVYETENLNEKLNEIVNSNLEKIKAESDKWDIGDL